MTDASAVAGGWWTRRSLRFRVTIVATAVLAIGLACGSAGLAALFYHQRLEAVDATIHTESGTLTTLIRSGQLPDPLPVPAGQPVLAQVVDARGTVRAATPAAGRVVPLVPLAVLRQRVSAGSFTTSESALGPSPLRAIVTPGLLQGVPVFVVSAVSFEDVHATLSALFHTLLLAVPIVLVAAGIATWLALGSALRPVDELREAADEVARTSGARTRALPVPAGDDELARLALTLNRMLERLQESADMQRAFVADAAHELRSPIASVRAQLEVALATPTDLREWRSVAAGALVDVDRVAVLADDMLLLARLDAGVGARARVCDLGELLGVGRVGVSVEADEQALRRAFDNLLSNARRHARTAVEVRVDASIESAVVTVDDDGRGVSLADRQRVFDRWVRLDEARGRDEGGAGLGLAIARSAVEASHGRIELGDAPIGGCGSSSGCPGSPPKESSATRVSSAPGEWSGAPVRDRWHQPRPRRSVPGTSPPPDRGPSGVPGSRCVRIDIGTRQPQRALPRR